MSFKRQSPIPTRMCLDEKVEKSNYGVASLFHEFFHSVYSYSKTTNPRLSNSLTNSLANIDFTPEDVLDILLSMDITKAMGLDGLPNYLLKYCAISLYEPLYHLFNLCITHSYLPNEWKIHKVIPIHKSGDKNSVKNYRPISLLPCISKVLFKVVYDHMCVLSLRQFGFLKHRSTIQQVTYV